MEENTAHYMETGISSGLRRDWKGVAEHGNGGLFGGHLCYKL